MRFRPNQCPKCQHRSARGTEHDHANDSNPEGTFLCFSLGTGHPRLVQKALIAKRKCHFYEKECFGIGHIDGRDMEEECRTCQVADDCMEESEARAERNTP